jgi:ubiquinone/menaquinone biosynthesis C-methylase UbiE
MNVDDRSRGYYDAFATHYEENRHFGYHQWLDDRSAELIRGFATDADVLEVGCGTGLILNRIAPLARRAVGLDLSPGMLAVARERGLEVVEGSARELPFEDASFDLLYSFKVLAHVPDLARVFSEMARVVRPGGRLVLEFYNRQSLRWWVRRLRPAGKIGDRRTEDDVYTRFHTQRELLGLLPDELQFSHIEGLRVATLLPQLFQMPGLGATWTQLEDALSNSWLRRYAGFLVLVLERK